MSAASLGKNGYRLMTVATQFHVDCVEVSQQREIAK
tara:strand:+ start:95 stop:202 length:108 start_codon:yes stop_codon:yes gene_type:complete